NTPAHDIDQGRLPAPPRVDAEHFGGPLKSQVYSAESLEDSEGSRRDAEPPAEAHSQEGRDGKRPGRMSAREGGIELRGATVTRERVHVRECIARPRSIDQVLDRLRGDDRDGEKEEDVERGGPEAPPPQRNGHQEDHVDAGEDREENHDPVENRIRPREVPSAEEPFIDA